MYFVKKLFKSKKAQSMVEMAIILPLLLLMLFGIIEFGRIMGAYMIIHDLAREGVRQGVVGMSDTDIKSHIITNDSFLSIDSGDITITPATRTIGDPLTVKIDYGMEIITPFIRGLFEDEVPSGTGIRTLHAEYVMRIEKL